MSKYCLHGRNQYTAYKLGLLNTTVQRVWLIPGFYTLNWWNSTDTHCKPEELRKAINYVILTDTLNLRQDAKKSIAGMTGSEYEKKLKKYPPTSLYYLSSYHPFGYDTAWAVALALNKTLNILKSNPTKYKNRLLEDFNYNDTEMKDILLREMFALNFEGVSGAVKFDKYGDRSGTLTVLQRVNGTRNFVGIYDGIKEVLEMRGRFFWRDGRIPSDGSKNATIVNLLVVDFSLCMVMVALSAIGIGISVVFFYANHKYRNTPIMKMSSAKLNVFICIGATLMYLSIIFYAIYQGIKYSMPQYVPVMCEVSSNVIILDRLINLINHQSAISIDKKSLSLWKWFLPVGFTLAFGAIFSKTFRIYIIYASVQGKPRRRKLLDKSLFQLVGLLVFIDIIILSLWSGIDPLRSEVQVIDSRISPDDPDTRIDKRMTTCTSPYMIYWMLILGTEKAVFLLFGAVVAYGTRNVSIKELNDSKLITIVVYNFILIAIVTGPLRFALHTMTPTGYFAADAILIWLCITTMLCIIFIPKLQKVNKVNSQDVMKSIGTLPNSIDRSTGNYNRANSASGSVDSIIDKKNRRE
ncbi:uncharacterized protein TRIADDRAFT_55426 [Trichoplax adhaerens]|uniref:G-protein coupled receptors family 3 profile domain-containing protein n=1 Tax=Trichoplax adhaerens TaxID=10228 RepID=B3RUV3_TRIAD|nr:hypothetical protein TRIADDRAFT_55426 [Trichoplax adhaerens]EDV25890.1 hypothetical protein TRIADDRAFT_55426 [Trichoplax adhaerens]|eukprot:XP_002111923.1 hypothetical protein TRIADDRAFT_55426 [Trichoplax adhaerens]